MVFVDRKAKYPGRWTMKKPDGTSEVVTLVRNDEPEVEGTPMNAETLNALSDVAGADVARLQAEAARDAAAGSATKASGSASAAEESKAAAATSEANAAKHEEAAKKAAGEAGAKAGTDKTLSIENAPADAAATGKELAKKADKDLIVDKDGNVLFYSKAAVDEMLIGYRKRLGPIPNDDFNDATEEGVYTYVNDVKNGYANQAAGTLEVYNNGNNGTPGTYGVWLYQVAYPVNGYAPFFRTRTDANDWTPWQHFVMESGMHPVGSIYMSASSTSPASLFGGTWEEIASERVLMGRSSSHAAGTTVNAGLPNITGVVNHVVVGERKHSSSGALSLTYNGNADSDYEIGSNTYTGNIALNASISSSVYGKSTTVQPAAYYVYMWRRIK